MKKPLITAVSLRMFMFAAVFLLIGLLLGGFYYAQDWLTKYSAESKTAPVQSSTNTDDQTLKQLQNDLASQRVFINKAAGITVSSKNYLAKITQDLNKYASDSGITIAQTNPVQAPASITSLPLPAGVSARYISVTLGSPVSYTGLLKFIKALETNIPKIQLTGISLTQALNPKGSVKVDPLIIEVYTR